MENFNQNKTLYEVELPILFARVASELSQIESRAARLEATTSDILERAPEHLKCTAVTELQEFDLLIQSINSVSDFLMQLQLDAHNRETLNIGLALNAVKLGEIANRLSGLAPPDSDGSHIEPDLF